MFYYLEKSSQVILWKFTICPPQKQESHTGTCLEQHVGELIFWWTVPLIDDKGKIQSAHHIPLKDHLNWWQRRDVTGVFSVKETRRNINFCSLMFLILSCIHHGRLASKQKPDLFAFGCIWLFTCNTACTCNYNFLLHEIIPTHACNMFVERITCRDNNWIYHPLRTS